MREYIIYIAIGGILLIGIAYIVAEMIAMQNDEEAGLLGQPTL